MFYSLLIEFVQNALKWFGLSFHFLDTVCVVNYNLLNFYNIQTESTERGHQSNDAFG